MCEHANKAPLDIAMIIIVMQCRHLRFSTRVPPGIGMLLTLLLLYEADVAQFHSRATVTFGDVTSSGISLIPGCDVSG